MEGSHTHGFLWVAVKELHFLGNPRFPLKGSFEVFQGDIDIDVESYHDMDIYQIIWHMVLGYGN